MNNAVFRKNTENVRKHRDITLATKERRRNLFSTVPLFRTKKFFTENLLAREIRKTQMLMNKSVDLGLLILSLSITVAYEFW